jgi:hypothetical protein
LLIEFSVFRLTLDALIELGCLDPARRSESLEPV